MDDSRPTRRLTLRPRPPHLARLGVTVDPDDESGHEGKPVGRIATPPASEKSVEAGTGEEEGLTAPIS